jgi:hypothetical protein
MCETLVETLHDFFREAQTGANEIELLSRFNRRIIEEMAESSEKKELMVYFGFNSQTDR